VNGAERIAPLGVEGTDQVVIRAWDSY
jgi:hypothetical protein